MAQPFGGGVGWLPGALTSGEVARPMVGLLDAAMQRRMGPLGGDRGILGDMALSA